MKHLSRITIIVILVAVVGGVVPAAAIPPDPVADPTVTVDLTTATCNDGGLQATPTVAVEPMETATLTEFNMYVEKIGIDEAIAYRPTINEEYWGFNWWTGSADPMTLPFTLDTTDDFGISWIYHSKVNATFTPTGFHRVNVYVGAANSKGKGRGNQARVWEGHSWTVQCTGTTADIVMNAEFTWCREDAWTHDQGYNGLVWFDPTTEEYKSCGT